MKKAKKKPKNFGFLGFCAAVVAGGALITFLLLIINAQLGLWFDADLDNQPKTTVQVLFWFTVWGTLSLVLIMKFLKGHKSSFFTSFRKTFLIFGVLILLGTSLSFAGNSWSIWARKNSGNAAEICDMKTTLRNARYATVPLITDTGTGTAFTVTTDGKLVTAYHVIEGARTIDINWGGETGKIPATVLQAKPEYDLALLKVNFPLSSFLPLVENPEPAEQVYALGWPGQFLYTGQATVSSGIVSRLITGGEARQIDDSIPADIDFIQTDAAINPGNSGGPLINKCGAIGVINAISTVNGESSLPREEGVVYSVGASTIKRVFGL